MHRNLLFLLGLIFLACSVSASSYNLEFNQVDNTLLVNYHIALDSEEEISLNLPADAYSLSSNVPYILDNDLFRAKAKELNLSYITSEPLESSKGDYYFVDTVAFPVAFESASIKLTLQEGYFADADKIFPNPSQIATDGEQITITWDSENTKAGDDMPLFVIIKSKAQGMTTWLTWVLSILILLLILYFIYDKMMSRQVKKPAKKAKKKNKPKKEEKEESPMESHLMESEKAIINALKQADRGELWQKELQIKTGFSKAKLSRVIRNLESRKLLDKVSFGNTNKIRLK
jgi:uncharacterized membrane protein